MRKACAVGIALLLLTAACGGKSNKAKTTGASSSTTENSEVTSTTAAVSAGASTTAAAGKTATTKAGSPATTSKPTIASGAPAPATPGWYDYAQAGSSSVGSIPANGTLKVDAANANNVQVLHRFTDPNAAPSDTTIAYRSNGPFITDTVIRQGGQEITCHFDPAVAAPPWPATDGKPINGHANCGAITVDVTGSITGHRTTTLDGKSIDVVVAKVTITTHGSVESTSEQEQWWAPSLRMVVHSHDVTHATFNGFPINSDTTADLKSGTPR